MNPLTVSEEYRKQQLAAHPEYLAIWPFKRVLERDVLNDLFKALGGRQSPTFPREDGLFSLDRCLEMSHLTNGSLNSLLSRLLVFVN